MLTDADILQRMRELFAASLPPPQYMQIGWPESPASAGPASTSAPALVAATVVNLNTLADPPPVPPLLAALEDAKMVAVAVQPEIDQSLAQVDATLASIDTASTSIEPAPKQIPSIQERLAEASAKVNKTLEDI